MLKPCSQCVPPQLIDSGSWDSHLQAHKNELKPSSTERGYGTAHRALRQKWAVRVKTGAVICARMPDCLLKDRPEGPVILPDRDRWELDHNDDREGYLGPSHLTCNRATAGRHNK